MKKAAGLAGRMVSALSGAVLLALGAALGLMYCTISMNGKETVSYRLSGPGFWLLAGAAALGFWLLAGRLRRPRRLTPGRLFALGALVWLAAGLHLMRSIDPSYVAADALLCQRTAQEYLAGDFHAFFDYGYMEKCPHQLGLLTLILLLGRIGPVCTVFQAMQLVMILGVNFFLWKCSEEALGRGHPAQLWVVGLSFLFLPLLFYMLFLYNSIPSLFLIMAGLYGFLRFERSRSWLWAAQCAACLTVACVLRSNSLIAVIALACVCALWLLRCPRRLGSLVLAAALILCPLAAQQALRQHYRRTTGAPLSGGLPGMAYVMMGLQEGGRGCGWYTDYLGLLYQSSPDPAVRSETARRDVRARLEEMADAPGDTLVFFGKKLLSTWCEPTYQSLFSGPSSMGGEECEGSPVLMSLYGGGKAYRLFYLLTHVLAFFLYLLAGAYPFLRRRLEGREAGTYELFAQAYFLGGFLFHLFWETKSQYVFGYAAVLLPLAARSLALLCGLHQHTKERIP